MATLKVGDIVTRKSYNGDLLFKVVSLSRDTALLRGISFRVMSDAPLDDLVLSADLPRKLEDIYPARNTGGKEKAKQGERTGKRQGKKQKAPPERDICSHA